MDRIIVRTNADMQRVLDWSGKLKGVTVKAVFPQGEIDFQEEEIKLRFRDEGESLVWFEAEMAGVKVVEWRSNLETGDIPELHINGDGDRKVKMAMLLATDNTVAKCVGKFRALMLFSMYYREEVERTKVISRVEKKDRKGGPRKGSNRRMLTIRKYTIGDEILNELPRKYERHTDGWGVRGHYRNLRSGRVVWVRPHTKGQRENVDGRDYIV